MTVSQMLIQQNHQPYLDTDQHYAVKTIFA